jgi:hypothetical protein
MPIIIRTKYIGATDTKGARILAKALGKQASISYPYELSGEEVHRKAAWAWVERHLTRNGWDDPSRFKLRTRFDLHTGYAFEVEK